MPIGGENVGQAYVRIFADGSSIPHDIRDALHDAEPEIRGQARDHGDAYDEEFRKRTSQKDIGKGIRDSLDKSMARADVADAFFNSRHWQQFQNRLKKEFGESGALAAKSLQDEFTKKGSLDGLDRAVENIHTRIDRSTKDLLGRENSMLNEAYKMNLAHDAKVLAAHVAMLKQREADEIAWRNDYTKITRAIDKTSLASSKEMVGAWTKVRNTYDSVRTGQMSLLREFGKSKDEIKKMGKDAFAAANGFEEFARKMDRTSEGIGKAFGKGSRNDALNFFGSLIGGVTGLTSAIPRLLGKVDNLSNGLGGGGGGAGKGLASVMGSVASSAAGIVVAIGVVGLAISAVSSLVSGLVAAVIALAGSLAFALGAVGGVALGLAGPLVAAIGVAVLGFSHLGAKGTDVLVKLTDQLQRLQFAAGEELGKSITKMADGIRPVVGRLEPLVRNIASAVGDVGESWVKSMNSPGFNTFLNRIDKFIPNAIRRMGSIIGNVAGGIGGLFTGAIPITKDFLGWLDRVTQKFSDWANSAKGQHEIKNFFNDAKDSLESVWGFLKKVFNLTVDLLDKGKGSGDNLFDSMGKSVQKLIDYINKNPDAVGQWFSDGKDMAKALGDAVVGLSDIMASLDDPKTRKGVTDFLKIVGDTAAAVANAVGAVTSFKREIEKLTGIRLSPLGLFRTMLTRTPNIIAKVIGFFKNTDWSHIWDGITSSLSGVGDKIRGALKSLFGGIQMPKGGALGGAQIINPGAILHQIDRVVGFFRKFPGRVTGAVGNLGDRLGSHITSLSSAASRTVNRAVAFFRRLPSRAQSAVGNLGDRLGNRIAPLAGDAQRTITRVVSFFRGLPGRALGAIRSIPGQFSGIMSRLPAPAQNAVSRVLSAIHRIPGGVRSALSGVPGAFSSAFGRAASAVAGIPGRIVGMFSGLAGRILGAIGSINIGSLIHVPSPGAGVPFVPGIAKGGMFGGITNGTLLRRVGEDGREAIVPLERDLARVDPSVRALSAIAQGMKVPGMASGGMSKGIDASGWTIVSNSEDARAVARETVSKMIALTY